jgi:hypothetical protein
MVGGFRCIVAEMSLKIHVSQSGWTGRGEKIRCYQRHASGARASTIDKRIPCTHCETMKNITVSLDADTYRRARIIAAERETSVSALVKQFLTELASGESEFERLKRLEEETRAKITSFSASENLPRDELYDRRF